MEKLSYKVKISPDGNWKVNPNVRTEVYKKFVKDSTVEIEMFFIGMDKKRTLPQNEYYWGVVVPLVTAGFINAGNDLRIGRYSDYDKIHELLKEMFIPESEMVIFDRMGRSYALGKKSTTNLDTKEFMKYVKDIRDWTFNNFGINIPDPNKDMEVVDENGELLEITVEEFLRSIKNQESYV